MLPAQENLENTAKEQIKNYTEINGQTASPIQDKLDQLKQLFPEAFTEGLFDPKKFEKATQDLPKPNREGYELNWAGKTDARQYYQSPTSNTLQLQTNLSQDLEKTQNIFIEGENLEVLKILRKSYTGKVKCIYIDPPYNTGVDRLYPDKYAVSQEEEETNNGTRDEDGEVLVKNTKNSGRFHSKWLSMMYPRLMLARELLSEDGVIFVSIDDNEQANLKLLMDEVFGGDSFIHQFIWNSSTGGGIRAKYANQNHEYALCYAKNKELLPMFFAPLSLEAVAQYNKEDKKGRYREKDFAWATNSNNINQKYLFNVQMARMFRLSLTTLLDLSETLLTKP